MLSKSKKPAAFAECEEPSRGTKMCLNISAPLYPVKFTNSNDGEALTASRNSLVLCSLSGTAMPLSFCLDLSP